MSSLIENSTYEEDDGIIYLNTKQDTDEEEHKKRYELAKQIREMLKKEQFEEVKQYLPPEYEILLKEWRQYIEYKNSKTK